MKSFAFVVSALALGVGVLSGSSLAASASSQRAVKLMIVHVQSGCHTWSTARMQPPALTLSLRRGDRLNVGNVDVDAHRLVQSFGPKLRFAGMMMTGGRTAVTFSKAGVYRFKTIVVEMKGMPEVKTNGPDHNLLLTVRVS